MDPLDYFEYSNTYKAWVIKPSIRDVVGEKGEVDLYNKKVYFEDKRYYAIKDAESYLKSIGSKRVNDIYDADIIITDVNLWYSEKTQPTTIPEMLQHYKKVFSPYYFGRLVAAFKVSDTETVELTEDVYRNICELFGSKNMTNQRMACTMLPTIKWSNNMFLLTALFGNYIGDIRKLKMSQTPGFSKWASIRITFWTRNSVELSTILPYMEDQNTETIKYIKYIIK